MTEQEKKDEKKIIIDEDWKKEAQREKEILAAQEKSEEEKGKKQRPRAGQMPRGDFAALLSMLTTQALFAMGVLQVEGHDKTEPDLDLAKYNIDMLETLEEKTKGNLSKNEKRVLENTLSQVRMAYVKVAG